MCERERERRNEGECVCERVRRSEGECVYVCVRERRSEKSVCDREIESMGNTYYIRSSVKIIVRDLKS